MMGKKFQLDVATLNLRDKEVSKLGWVGTSEWVPTHLKYAFLMRVLMDVL